nr:MAG TPA: hypothetical protein [Caudoviricetes sp.]
MEIFLSKTPPFDNVSTHYSKRKSPLREGIFFLNFL